MSVRVTFECPLCHARFVNPRAASWIGRKVRCEKCQKVFVLEHVDSLQDAAGNAQATVLDVAISKQGDHGVAGDKQATQAPHLRSTASLDGATSTATAEAPAGTPSQPTSGATHVCPFCRTPVTEAQASLPGGTKIQCSKCKQTFVLKEDASGFGRTAHLGLSTTMSAGTVVSWIAGVVAVVVAIGMGTYVYLHTRQSSVHQHASAKGSTVATAQPQLVAQRPSESSASQPALTPPQRPVAATQPELAARKPLELPASQPALVLPQGSVAATRSTPAGPAEDSMVASKGSGGRSTDDQSGTLDARSKPENPARVSLADRIVNSVLATTYDGYMDAGFNELTFGMSITAVQKALGLPLKSLPCVSHYPIAMYTCGDHGLYLSDGRLIAIFKKYDSPTQDWLKNVREMFGPFANENIYEYNSTSADDLAAESRSGFEAFQFCSRAVVVARSEKGRRVAPRGLSGNWDRCVLSVIDKEWVQSVLTKDAASKHDYLVRAKEFLLSVLRGQKGRFANLGNAVYEQSRREGCIYHEWQLPVNHPSWPSIPLLRIQEHREPGMGEAVVNGRIDYNHRWPAGGVFMAFAPVDSFGENQVRLDDMIQRLVRRCDSGIVQDLFEPQDPTIDVLTNSSTGSKAYQWTTPEKFQIFIGFSGRIYVSWLPKQAL